MRTDLRAMEDDEVELNLPRVFLPTVIGVCPRTDRTEGVTLVALGHATVTA